MFIPEFLNTIPLAALAAILIMVGYKLAKPSLFKKMYIEGQDQFIPFIVTIVAVLFTDLLIGILIGLLVGLAYVLFTNFRSAIKFHKEENHHIVDFKKDVFFYNRAELIQIFSRIKSGDKLTLDGRNVDFMDHDIFLAIEEFVQEAAHKNIEVNVIEITRKKITFRKKDESNVALKVKP
jgi:carbonic anhydrase